MSDNASRDQNRNTTLLGVSTLDGESPVKLWADPDTHALEVNASVTVTGGATASNQTDGSQKTQIVDAGGESVTVTGGKLDVNASIDTTGLALDATLTGGTQKSQLVDAGGEAATVTGGKLDVNASIDTTGLATSAKQDTGNTYLSTLAGAVSATHVQADVLTLPAITGTVTVNTISGFATETTLGLINAKLVSGTDIGDVTINNSTGASAVNIQDGGNTITVDGTVTANLSSTDNTVLDNIQLELEKINSLVPAIYDYISLSYTSTNLTGVVFKTGGSGGTTVSTLTLGYDGSNNLTSVTKT
jgi:hypothetical protein